MCASAPSRGALQHDGHGAFDEFAGGGAGDVAAGLRGDSGPLWRTRAKMAYETGRRIVEMVHEDLTPARILTRAGV